MAKQRIYYTILPRGFNPNTGNRRISLFVSPRLVPETGGSLLRGGSGAQLSQFPDWVDWPDTVRNRLDFSLKITAGGQEYEPSVTLTSPPPDSEAWAELCPPDAPIGDFTGPPPLPFGDRYVVSNPGRSLNDYLVNTLVGLAADPNEPDIDTVRQAFSEIDLYDPARGGIDLDAQLAEIIDQLSERGTVRNDPPRPDLDIAQTLLLNEPTLEGLKEACEAARSGGSAQTLSSSVLRRGEPDRPPPPEPPELEFHDAISAAAEHPTLLRRLGLILDFDIGTPDGVGAQPREELHWMDINLESRMPPADNIPTPRLLTRCLASTTVFEAAPRVSGPTTQRGLLRLADRIFLYYPRYSLLQVDTQGASMRMVEHLKNLAIAQIPGSSSPLGPGTTVAPPPYRAAGISLSQWDRASSVRTGYDRQVALNKAMLNDSPSRPFVTLDREDITRGFVFDVFDSESNAWYSLCRRIGRARFGAAADDTRPEPLPGDVTWEDEGWVSSAYTEGYQEGDTVKRVTDAVATWANGWSMVTQRPGKSVDAEEMPVEYTQAVGDFKLAVRYAAKPGSLPPQRFGRTYRMRARAVDLAGNVITSDEATALASPHVLQTPYQRYEPVQAPTVLMRKEVTEAESPDLVVIRSNFGTATGATVVSDRHIFPPSMDQFRSECHGMFDAANGISPGVYEQIAAREDGAYDERDSSGNFVHPNAEADPLNYDAPYFDVDTPQFEVEGGSQARMPSLPDPMCGGLAFVGLPGLSAGSVQVYDIFRGGATWPNVRPVRLRVFESANFVPPALVGDELRVGLPKAEARNVSLSCSLVASRINHMALPGQLDPSLQALIINGQHWAITPARKLRLVHAVRQPLRPTEFQNLAETRFRGQTSMLLEDTMATSRKSTERVEVYADWVEKTDYLPPGVDEFHEPQLWEPERAVQVSSKVFERAINVNGGPDGSLPISVRHELNSLRHIPEISYRTVATTRFKEYFTERADVNLQETDVAVPLPTAYSGAAAPTSAGIVEDSERVTNLDGTRTFERNQPGEVEGFYTMDYEAGTITRFDVDGRDNMPDQVRVTYIKGSITRPSPAPTLKRALSVRRPDPPKIQYAMPTFRRTEESSTNYNTALREVTGLRVFLDRPWWSSGDGELLGVMISNESTTNDATRNFVTRRGQDPIWAGENVGELPNLLDFTATTSSRNNVFLPEINDRLFTVAGHEVRPDREQLRWYCDIDISPGSAYTPFIRLALARYQPNSIFGLELSPVVQLDYMQLYPNRYANVFRPNEGVASLYISGETYQGGRYKRSTNAVVPQGSVIEVQVEQRRPGLEARDDLFGWIPKPGTSPVQLDYFEDPKSSSGFSYWTADFDASTGDRLAIREYEQFGPPDGAGLFQRRLVYAEVLYVPPYIGDL